MLQKQCLKCLIIKVGNENIYKLIDNREKHAKSRGYKI